MFRRPIGLAAQMLTGKGRQYIIEKAKLPLHKVILVVANRFPEPTRENCTQHNSIILLDIRDEFLERQANTGRRELLAAGFKIFICIYEHDIFYRQRFNWAIQKIKESNWSPKDATPRWCWDWPDPDEKPDVGTLRYYFKPVEEEEGEDKADDK